MARTFRIAVLCGSIGILDFETIERMELIFSSHGQVRMLDCFVCYSQLGGSVLDAGDK